MGKIGGRFWIPDYVVDYMLSTMSGMEVKVLLILARHANKCGVAWPSVKTIATMSGGCERTVQRALRSLASSEKGLVMKITKGTGGHQVTTRYRLFFQRWLVFKKAQAKAGITEEDIEERGDASVTVELAEGRHECHGFQDIEEGKGRHSEQERVTSGSIKGDTGVGGRNSTRNLLKEDGQDFGEIFNRTEQLATAADKEQRRQKLLRQAEDLRATA